MLASKAGYGFVMPEDEAVAMRRAGKQVLNVDAKGACFCLPVDGDHLAVIGDNGKMLIFPLSELPEMPRGKGVKLQSYREGGLRDGLVFTAAEGAAWTDRRRPQPRLAGLARLARPPRRRRQAGPEGLPGVEAVPAPDLTLRPLPVRRALAKQQHFR